MKKEYDFSKGRRGPVLTAPPGKTRITIRLDDDILGWFREQARAAGGGSYQTMINDVLRSVVESRQRESLEQTLRRVLREELPKPRKASGRAAAR
ncbi:MAG: CopG family transcriptional regulator [Myxococcales bacterium]|nr:CopG family transcriptional regulator [Myxococcales bacterium]